VAFLVMRLLLAVPILFIVRVLCFSMINLIPGDPATVTRAPRRRSRPKSRAQPPEPERPHPGPVPRLARRRPPRRPRRVPYRRRARRGYHSAAAARHDRACHRDLSGEPHDSRGRRHPPSEPLSEPLSEPAGDVARLPEHGRGARRNIHPALLARDDVHDDLRGEPRVAPGLGLRAVFHEPGGEPHRHDPADLRHGPARSRRSLPGCSGAAC
jgi:hypothetical protein